MSDDGSVMREQRPAMPTVGATSGLPPPLPCPSSLVARLWSLAPRLSSFAPLVLVSVGAASVIYGAKYRLVPVLGRQMEVQVVEHEEEVAIHVPSPFSPVMPEGPTDPSAGGPPLEPHRMEPVPGFLEPPSMKVKKITYVPKRVIKEVTDQEPEPVLVWEVTVGGVVRAKSGMVMRTYGPTEGGEQARPLSLCPS